MSLHQNRSIEEYVHCFQDLYIMITNMEDSEAIHIRVSTLMLSWT